jgi:hypothetical protein
MFNKLAKEASLLNKSSSSADALGVNEFVTILAIY